MEERLRRVLRERVEEYLAGVERLLGSPTPVVGWEVLRQRLRPMVAGWQHTTHRRRKPQPHEHRTSTNELTTRGTEPHHD